MSGIQISSSKDPPKKWTEHSILLMALERAKKNLKFGWDELFIRVLKNSFFDKSMQRKMIRNVSIRNLL